MATTKDLSVFLDHELGKGQGPFLVRMCQDAGLLPKVKRGGWRAMETLTAEHLADFLMALAGTRSAGERNANSARESVDFFGDLVVKESDANSARESVERFGDLVVTVGDQNQTVREALILLVGDGGLWDGYTLLWVLFSNFSRGGEVEARLRDEKADAQRAYNFCSPEKPPQTGVADGFMVSGDFFCGLGELLLEPAEADAEPAK